MSAECASVNPCGLGVPVTVLWTTEHVWPATSSSVTAEEGVNVAPASVMTPNSRAPHVKHARPVQQSAQSTSKKENREWIVYTVGQVCYYVKGRFFYDYELFCAESVLSVEHLARVKKKRRVKKNAVTSS